MAEREFDTITYLLRVFCGVELKKGNNILDLGSGDQFLKNEFNKLPEPIDLYSKNLFHLNISGYETAAELINEKIKEFEQ